MNSLLHTTPTSMNMAKSSNFIRVYLIKITPFKVNSFYSKKFSTKVALRRKFFNKWQVQLFMILWKDIMVLSLHTDKQAAVKHTQCLAVARSGKIEGSFLEFFHRFLA